MIIDGKFSVLPNSISVYPYVFKIETHDEDVHFVLYKDMGFCSGSYSVSDEMSICCTIGSYIKKHTEDIFLLLRLYRIAENAYNSEERLFTND